MDPIEPHARLVRNIGEEDAFQPYVWNGVAEHGTSVLQLDRSREPGTGFHIYRMAPGAVTIAHEHTSDEHFFLIQGDLEDHDGHVYGPGDVVLLKKGTRHSSRTRNGCVLVVYLESAEMTGPTGMR